MIDEAAVAEARDARARILQERSTEQLIDTLAEAGRRWRANDSPERSDAATELRAALPLTADMIDHGLDLIFAAIDRESLQQIIAEQTDTPGDLGACRPTTGKTLECFVGPEVVYHSLAGNVPGLSVAPIVCGVLARSVTLIRDSKRQPVLTRAFSRTIAEIDPLLGRLLVPLKPAVTALDIRRALGGALSAVELHGSDAVIAEQARAFSGSAIPTAQHGSRTSAVIAVDGADPSDWAEAIAHDVVMYEGLGCLTPHTIIVEGDTALLPDWCEALRSAFDNLEKGWPRHRQSLELETARRAFLERAEVSSLLSDGMQMLRGTNDCWCIVPTSAPPSGLGPGMRCLTLVSASDREQSIAILSGMSSPIAGVGLTLSSDAIESSSTATQLRERTGATLVCSAGEMQSPPLVWEQDGRRRLGDQLDWRTIAT